MKLHFLLLLAWNPIFAQLQFTPVTVTDMYIESGQYADSDYYDHVFDYLSYSFQQHGTTKSFTFVVTQCTSGLPQYDAQSQLILFPVLQSIGSSLVSCVNLTESQALLLTPVQAVQAEFFAETLPSQREINYAPIPYAPPPATSATAGGSAASRTVIPHQAAAAFPDPQVIFYDGIGVQMVKYDWATQTIVTQFPVSFYNVYGLTIRPFATGSENEVWATVAGGIAILDMGGGSVLANVPVTATGTGEYPVGLAFTNDGAFAIETLAYSQPDSFGDMGAILVFNAATRTLASTLPLLLAPLAVLMAPDGLTVYVLGNAGGSGPVKPEITYYDVLSGTADLTAPLPFEVPASGIFIHPDGTRLLCGQCGENGLVIFDLTTRTIANTFTLSLAQGAGATTGMNMSQDGSTVAFTDILNNVYVLDTRYGNLLATYNTGNYSVVFPGPGGN